MPMPTKPVNIHKYTVAANVVKVLTDSAHKDLSDAISCCFVALDNSSSDYYEQACKDFLDSLRRKVLTAMSAACLSSQIMPESPHGEESKNT